MKKPSTLKSFYLKHKTRCRFYSVFLAFIIFSALCVYGLVIIFDGLPSIDDLEEYTPPISSKIFDVNNNQIGEFTMEKREVIPLENIPRNMVNSIIAMEDTAFFNHPGISVKGTLRAVLTDIVKGKRAQGGSTITQQLAKTLYLTRKKEIIRKLREYILALQIEHRFSKQEILQLYLNQIWFGEGAYGIKEAARTYFGKNVSELSLSDCALLTAQIAAPSRFNPFSYPERAKNRRNTVLMRMYEEGFITKEEYDGAKLDPLPEEKTHRPLTAAPYFVEYVRRQLEPRYGVDMLWKGGLKIYTTLDLNAQTKSEEIMEKHLAQLDENVAKSLKPSYFEKRNSSETPKLQGSFMVMDNKSGAIRVMIGGRDYRESKFNRAVQASRQPGSTFKPFVWMAAITNGMTATDIVDDTPMTYYYDGKDWRRFDDSSQFDLSIATQPFIGDKEFQIWVPNNVDKRSLGRLTLRRGLEQSRNIVAINLTEKVGPTTVVSVARRAGITSRMRSVLSIALGTPEVTLFEMVNAFGTFANAGIKVTPYGVARVEDQNGIILEEFAPQEREVFTPQQSYILINLMKGVVDRGTGVRAKSLNRPIAGKTGTSQDHRDLWFIGSTPDITAGAWMGYDDYSTIENQDWTGGATVLPFWVETMGYVLKDYPVTDFRVPEGITFSMIDSYTGRLALPNSRNRFLEAFEKGTEPRGFDAN